MPDPHLRGSSRRLAAGFGLALLVAAMAYISTLRLGGTPTARPTADVNVLAAGSATIGPGIGQTAPDFVSAATHEQLLAGLDGNPIRVADFAGKPLWIVFWATWCTPCQQEANDIRAVYTAHQGSLAVLAIDVQEPAAAARAFQVKNSLNYTIGLDSTAAVKALYGGWGLPAHFFVGADGVIRDRYLGQMTADLMEQHVQAILGPP